MKITKNFINIKFPNALIVRINKVPSFKYEIYKNNLYGLNSNV
jgi:hypothetical protein